MLKVVGSTLIIFACTAIGFDRSHKLQLHLNQLEMLKQIFVLIKKEMQYTMAPLPEIFLKISRGVDEFWKRWLEQLSMELQNCEKLTFEQVWDATIEKHFQESQFTLREKEELLQVGKNLSYMENIDLYLELLDISIERAREDAKTKKKLYQSIGIVGGIFLVIVLF